MTHSLPAGTTTSKASRLGTSPGYRYGSSRGTPLTVSRPEASQHCTRSPPTPITRFTKSRSSACSPRVWPIQRRAEPIGPCGSATVISGVNESAPSKTTTSPREMSPKRYPTFSTRIRSPTSRVFSIDPEGIEKACRRKVLTSSASTIATTARIGISRAADRLSAAFAVRWASRRARRGPSPDCGTHGGGSRRLGTGPAVACAACSGMGGRYLQPDAKGRAAVRPAERSRDAP